MGWNNMDGKELKLEKIWDDVEFNGNREFDVGFEKGQKKKKN
jgi:hypothetical protein